MSKPEVTVRYYDLGPSVELEEYDWIKTRISVEVTGGSQKVALKTAELEYWKAVELDLRLATEIKEAFDSAKDSKNGRKAIAKHAKKRIEVLSNWIEQNK